MVRCFRFLSAFGLFTAILIIKVSPAHAGEIRPVRNLDSRPNALSVADTLAPSGVMDIVTKAIYALNSFDIAAVANLYTPNAVVADDEPPYSWNGPTAGVQWVNAVEKACRNNRLTRLKGVIEPINFYQQSADNFYIVVPVSFRGNLPGKQHFSVRGAFTFVLRQVNGGWLIKSQAWMQQKALNGQD
jgi:ketosteroid isomerase-like protein